MGVIGKLAFWRKSSKKAHVCEAWASETPTASSPEGKNAEVQLHHELPDDNTEENNTRDAQELKVETVQAASEVASCDMGLPSSQAFAGSSSSSSGSLAKVPVQVGLHSSDADNLEAELCDEALCPLMSEPALNEALVADPPVSHRTAQDELNFDMPLSDVFAGVSQAFGPMIASSLQSAKWDKRAQALKAVGTMLHGLDLQGMAAPGSTGCVGKALQGLGDRVRSWRSCCHLLHHVMRDKVMPVRLASLELFHETFANAEGLVSQEECHIAVEVLIQHAMERLGDSNVRLHESARKCICFCAERPFLLGLDASLRRLRSRLEASQKVGPNGGSDRQKVYYGVLDAVNFLLQQFPGRRMSSRNLDDDEEDEEVGDLGGSWTAADIAPFIAAGMDDSLGPRVRSTVIVLAVTVYHTFGMEAMQPLLEDLRPAKQALLRQKFQESEDMDPEDFKRISAAGTTASSLAIAPSEPRFSARNDCFNDMIVCGSAVKVVGGHPMLPGCLGDPDEENLMDGILEETGMVFGGACILNEGFGHDERCSRPLQGIPRTLLEDDLEDEEHRVLEEELLQLGIDLNDAVNCHAVHGC